MLVEVNKLTFRTVTIGDSSVGKTSIVNRFIRDRFDPVEKNTIGAVFDTYTEEYDGRSIEVQIWDTAGQEQYRSLSPVYFRSAAAALLVFDIANQATFANIDEWLASFRQAGTERALLFLVGNKADLEALRQVAKEDAAQWAAEHKCSYYETSAKTGDGVNDLFRAIAHSLALHRMNEVESNFHFPTAEPPAPRQEARCC